jgi:putative peptidoglycan lipid II flippase
MAPATLAGSVAQISLIINTQIASRPAPGAVSWDLLRGPADGVSDRAPGRCAGDRVAAHTVVLPMPAGDHPRYAQTAGLGAAPDGVVAALPAMVGMALLAEPLDRAALFHYGRFGAHDVTMTRPRRDGLTRPASCPWSAIKVLAPGLHAGQDVRTPSGSGSRFSGGRPRL